MQVYTYVSQRGNNILSRGYDTDSNIRFNLKRQLSPTLFISSSKSKEEPWHDIYGKAFYPVVQSSISEAKDFIEQYKDVEGFDVQGMTNWVAQYIGEEFNHDLELDLSKVRVFTIDIETELETGQGFPTPERADEAIQLITVHDSIIDRYIAYTFKGVDQDKVKSILSKNNIDINEVVFSVHKDEYFMLKTFVIDWATNYPDAVTGWNIETFDIPYLVRRIERVVGDSFSAKLSPWGNVRERYIKKNNEEILAYDIDGVNLLDYLALMKKFTYGERDSWKLGDVAQDELGQTKLELEGSFRDAYRKLWNDFTAYNIIDVYLVKQLDQKMKLIELAFTIAYMARINPDEVFSPIRTWDSIIYHHLKNKKIVTSIQKQQRSTNTIAGGFVKDPQVGRHRLLASFDFASLYPHLMMTFNISPDTIVHGPNKPVNVDDLLKMRYDLSDLKDQDLSMTANGHTFRKDKRGFVPALVEGYYAQRSAIKKQMLKKEQEYADSKDESLVGVISSLNAKQMAVKILMNALYGAMASPYFRYFSTPMAEGITLSGQLAIQWVGNDVNKFLNKVCKTKEVDYVIYTDTDSIYVSMERVVETFAKEKDLEDRIQYMLKFGNDVMQKVINKSCEELVAYTNAYEQKLNMKLEKVCDVGIFVAKKRYSLNVHNSEGVQYPEPKISVTGLEMVRSSTPPAIRDTLKGGIKQVLLGSQSSVQAFVADYKSKHKTLDVYDIAFPRGVNGLKQYAGSPIYAKGCPIHVRAALLFNHYIDKLGLGEKYEKITEGSKMKFVYLKLPNPFKENVIGFIDKLPPEFKLHEYVDYDMMFEKSFAEAMKTLVTPIGWEIEHRVTLEDLFD